MKKVSEEFSKGNFEFAYQYFTDDIVWDIIGANIIKGKEPVIEYCKKMLVEMSNTAMQNFSVIADGNTIAVQGYCNYVSEKNTEAKVEYCDVYKFKEEKLQAITSYCIDTK